MEGIKPVRVTQKVNPSYEERIAEEIEKILETSEGRGVTPVDLNGFLDVVSINMITRVPEHGRVLHNFSGYPLAEPQLEARQRIAEYLGHENNPKWRFKGNRDQLAGFLTGVQIRFEHEVSDAIDRDIGITEGENQ